MTLKRFLVVVEYQVLSLFFLLTITLSIEGTSALKYLLTAILGFSVFNNLNLWKKDLKSFIKNKWVKTILIILVAYASYVFIHLFFFALDFNWSLSEFRTQLIYPLIYFFLAICSAIILKNSHLFTIAHLFTAIFFGFMVHVLIISISAIIFLIFEGDFLLRYGGLMDSPAYANYLTNSALAILIAEIISRLRGNKNLLLIKNTYLYVLFVLTIIATMTETIRLGDITLVMLGVVASLVFLHRNRSYSTKQRFLYSIGLIITLTIPLIFNILNDPRWQTLDETISLSLDTSADNMHWRDPMQFPAPKTSSGSLAGNSNYMRIAWARQSIHHVRLYPMGVGFGRDAFGQILEQKYPMRMDMKGYRGMSSHSGILDMFQAIGIPGVMIWVTFISALALFAYKKFQKEINAYSIAFMLIVSGFFLRSIVDSIIKDHILIQFLILVGIILVANQSSDLKNE